MPRLNLDESKAIRLAIAAWVVPLLVIAVLVIDDPDRRSVTPIYYEAALDWWNGNALYTNHLGMNYLPHFALVYSPFALVGRPWGDVIWRVASAGLLAWGVWRLVVVMGGRGDKETGRQGEGERGRFKAHRQRPVGNAERTAPRSALRTPSFSFLWATLLVMPIGLSPLRNGQANVLFAAAILHSVVFAMESRWWRGALWMVTALAIKPLAVVAILLAPWGYRPLAIRLAVTVLLAVLLPFLLAPADYVVTQYRVAAQNLGGCSEQLLENRFANVNGILFRISLEVRRNAFMAMALGSSVAFLGVWWLSSRRLAEPARGLSLLSLATGYLMLFNPMNESNGYVIAAPAMAAVTLWMLANRQSRSLGWQLAGLVVSVTLLPAMMRPVTPDLALWWKPMAMLVFTGVVVGMIPLTEGERQFAARLTHLLAGSRRRVAVLLLSLAGAVFLYTGNRSAPSESTISLEMFGPTSFAELPDRTFRVGSFNIHGGKGLDGVLDLGRTAACVEGLDFVGLMEVRSGHEGLHASQTAVLGRHLKSAWLFAPAVRRWWRDSYGNGLLTRVELQSAYRIPLPGTNPRKARSAILAGFRHRGETVRVLVAHADTGDDRQAQLQMLFDLFLALNAPAVLMGDLNTTQADPQLSRLLATPGVHDAVGEAPGSHAPAGEQRIDWIIVRGLKSVAAEYKPTPASDHPVIWAELELEQDRPLTPLRATPADIAAERLRELE